ncbi:hypothetical protein ACF0H5_013299 [Mactra antiquata]
MWRVILRISVLVSVCLILYTQSEGEGNGRKKRAVINSNSNTWDKCIIPYVHEGTYNADIQNSNIGFALQLFHKYTGFRFYQYSATDTYGDNSQWGLTHTSYANVLAGNGCFSKFGRRNGATNVTPCKGVCIVFCFICPCMHQQRINGEKASFSQPKGSTNLFAHYNTFNLFDFNSTVYDPSSTMHYGPKWFNKNEGDVLSLLDERDDAYLLSNDNWYYDFKEAQKFSGCLAEFDCSNAPTCQNDGYRSIVNGVCTCMCPRGLAPQTGCTTQATIEKTSYPSGEYSLLMPPGVTCPSGFESGSMTLYPKAGVLHDQTQSPGSYLHLSPGYTAGQLVHNVCTRTNPSGTYEWPAGEYCILRYNGNCPTGFFDASITMFGENAATVIGTVPDGIHTTTFEYKLCCRDDYHVKEEIDLPIPDTFVLYKLGSECQRVKDRYVVESWYTFHSMNAATRTDNSPKLKNGGGKHYYTRYCVYFPLNNDNCGNNLITLDSSTTTAEIISPGFSSGSYSPLQNCIWHVKAPEGTTIQLDFTEFEVSSPNSHVCSSYIVVKNWLPGLKRGRVICGHDYKKTIWSKFNTLSVEFVSGPDQESYKGFKLNVKLIQAEDKCYIGDGSNGRYTGTVGYSHDFKPCLPWSKVAHCLYNSFTSTAFTDHLDSNYCRTTGYAKLPWCYVEPDCETRPCDACMTGACFDRYTDCAAQIAANSNYCSDNVFGEAQRRCMSSCGFCTNHQPKATVGSGTITCGTPEAIEGISATPVQSTYAIGETVDYTCGANGRTMKRTCTSEGTWTELSMVCGACPEGWSVYNKRCYKWLGIYDVHTVSQAETVCAAMSATLPKILDQGTNDFIQKLVDVYQWDGAETWIGLRKYSGIRKWPNNEELSWSNWDTNQPSNKACTYMKPTGEWRAIGCGSSTLGHVVCEIDLSDADVAATCNDRRQNCNDFLSENPTVCEQYGDFAWHFCRKSCARGVCSTGTVCSDLGNLGTTGSIKHPSSSEPIPVGNYVEYSCSTGYYHTAGDLKRICQLDGTLSGTLPTCSDAANTNRVVLNPDSVIRRRYNFNVDKTILTANINFTKIDIPGTITEWHFYSNIVGTVAFVVLRETTTDTFTVVGKNVMSPTINDGKVVFKVPVNEQITVQSGDRIGIYHEQHEISFTKCSDGDMPENSGWLKSPTKTTADSITVSESLTFSSVSLATTCRIYSLHVVINPSA